MSYIEFQPQLTSQAVKCFWTLEEDQEVYNRDEILPDSYIDIVVNFGAPLLLEREGRAEVETSHTLFKGLMKESLRLRATGFTQLVGIRLYPWTITNLFGIRTDQANTLMLPRDGILGKLAGALDLSARRGDFTEAVAAFQEIITSMTLSEQSDIAPIKSAIELMYATEGKIRMADVAAQTYLSSSQFERRFKRSTGVSPKTLARLIRFEAIRNQMIMNPIASQGDLAHDFGYTDHAHFVHDFRTLAGCTPGAFAASVAQGQYAEFLQYP